MTPQRFTLPSTPAEADVMLGELGELVCATEWRRAALLAARVSLSTHGGDRRSKPKTGVETKESPDQFAKRRIPGLRSPETIRRCVKTWQKAVDEGLAEPAVLGAEIDLPNADWGAYYSDTPPWSNPAPAEPAPDEQAEDQADQWEQQSDDQWEQDDGLGLGQSPPLASDVEAGEDGDPDPEPLPPGVDPEKLAALSRRLFDRQLELMEDASRIALENLRDFRLSRKGQRRALGRIARIRKRLNDVEQAVRGTDEAG